MDLRVFNLYMGICNRKKIKPSYRTLINFRSEYIERHKKGVMNQYITPGVISFKSRLY